MELVKNVEVVIRRSAEEEIRKQAWLAAEDEAEQPDEKVVPPPGQRKDIYGLDLDKFNNPGGKDHCCQNRGLGGCGRDANFAGAPLRATPGSVSS